MSRKLTGAPNFGLTDGKLAGEQVDLLAQAASHLGEGVLITDAQLDGPGPYIVYVNEAMCRITGYMADELIGQPLRIFQGDRTDPEALDRVQAELSAGRPCRTELTSYRKDGAPYDAELFVTPLYDVHGRRTHFVSIHRDVTERKRVERRRAAQYALTSLLAQSPTIEEAIPEVLQVICEGLGWQLGEMWQYDPAGDLLRNEYNWHASSLDTREFITVTRETTFRRGEGLIGRVWSGGRPLWITDVTHDPDFVRAAAAHVAGLRAAFAFPISSAGQVLGVVAFLGAEQRDPDQELLNQMDAFGKQVGDFIQRKRAEEGLREREERLQAVLSTAADAIITIDHRGIINSVNPATEHLFGYARDELLGQNVSMLMPMPFCNEHDDYIARYLHTGQPRIIGIGRELAGRRKDGSTFPVGVAVSEVEHLNMFTGIIRDISAVKALQKEVLEIAADEDRRIGHELHDNTQQQLTGLGLFAQSLAEALAQQSSQQAGMATRLAQGIQETANHLHLLSRGLVPVEVDAEGLRASLAELSTRIREQYRVSCNFQCEGAVNLSDNFAATHLYRIAQEAVNNAIRHGRARHIEISLAGANKSLTLEVLDNGTGIGDKRDLGPGMGLRIMQYRAGLIGGTVQVAAGQEQGTRVSCTLLRETENSTRRGRLE